MNSTDLAFFAAVAETGGIGRAAVLLNTVQSNVTGRIRALEQALGTPLFYRGARGVTLTRAGERLLPYATQVARLLADAEQAVLSDVAPCGRLRLGAMETTAALRLPGLLARYAAAYPEVDIALELGPTETLVAAVLERRVEGAFVSGPVSQDDLVAVPVLEEELVLVAGARLASRDAVVAMLAARREARVLVFRSGCSYRQRLDAFLAAHGLLVSLLPRAVAEPMRRAGRISVHALPAATGRAQTLLVYRRDSLLTAAFERFLDHVSGAFGPPAGDEGATPVRVTAA
jgi:LysR family transcriptional regulator, cell division regulator